MLSIVGLPSASAQLVLEFGDPLSLSPISDIQLHPNQTRTIGVLLDNEGSATRLSGFTLELGIGGGGPPLGGIPGPEFTAVDLVTSTLFAGDHGAPVVNGGPNPFPGIGSLPQYLGLSLTTASAPISPEALGAVNLAPGRSLLGTLTVSAAGFTSSDSWTLQFVGAGSSTFLNDASNNSIAPLFQDSNISIVPEPQEYAAAIGFVLTGFALWRRRSAKQVESSCHPGVGRGTL